MYMTRMATASCLFLRNRLSNLVKIRNGSLLILRELYYRRPPPPEPSDRAGGACRMAGLSHSPPAFIYPPGTSRRCTARTVRAAARKAAPGWRGKQIGSHRGSPPSRRITDMAEPQHQDLNNTFLDDP